MFKFFKDPTPLWGWDDNVPVIARRAKQVVAILSLLFSVVACGGGGENKSGNNGEQGVFGANVSGDPTAFRGAGIIVSADQLMGGPMAQGRMGDVLLQNDKIRIIVQKPTRNTGIGTFGGNIIDADLLRPVGEAGADQFSTIFPSINVSWTVNYQRLEILNNDFSQGPVVVRATGTIDVYDYIQASIIVPFAKVLAGVDLYFDTRFNDVYDPFENIVELRNVSPTVVTDYILDQDKSYIVMQTHFFNDGTEDVAIPLGDWVNSSGTIELFVPKSGYVNATQIGGVSGLLYSAMDREVKVSYGYFFNPMPFLKSDGTFSSTDTLGLPGVIPVFWGEKFLSLIPLSVTPPTIFNKLKPGDNIYTRYFAVGSGDLDSVYRSGFDALGVSKVFLQGSVKNADGKPMDRVRVVVMDNTASGTAPVNVIFSNKDGVFSGVVASGKDAKAKLFGSGKYSVEVYQEGYVEGSGPKAGKCTGGTFDAKTLTVSGIECVLGSTAVINVNATEGGKAIPARITIVGFDPSPIHDVIKPEGFGKYTEIDLSERPYGVVDVLYTGHDGKVYPKGHPRIIANNQFHLEPGLYKIFITRGMEYSVFQQTLNVTAGAQITVNADLKRLLKTPGYVSADLHLHGVNSADSVYGLEARARAALAEGMDILLSTDHDFVTDYGPTVQAIGAETLIDTMVGDEVTPLNFGHFLAFPLIYDANSTTGGAYDYTQKDSDIPAGPSHDYVQGPSEIFKNIDAQNPGTQVLQVAHMLHPTFGNLRIAGLVTSTLFPDAEPLSSFGDPVNYRMHPNSNQAGGFKPPYPMGTSEMISLDSTALELMVGADPETFEMLMETALPTYFNLLNLGLIKTATSSSDSHVQVRDPLGYPRNYLRSSQDPKDGVGGYSQIDAEEIAVNTNSHRVVVSNGVFVNFIATDVDGGDKVGVGDTLQGSNIELSIQVQSIEYIDWDTIELYANTDTLPAADAMDKAYNGSAKNFYLGIPPPQDSGLTTGTKQKYFMKPLKKWMRDKEFTQEFKNGLRQITLKYNANLDQDTWFVVVVRNDQGKTMFPLMTKEIDPEKAPKANFLNLLETQAQNIGGVKAFAFTNPIFVDTDGNGFTAKYIANGKSPLAE